MSVVRVLQVFTVMDRGGAESMIMNYYRNIDRNKVQFDFLVHRKSQGAFDDEIEQLGGNIFKFDPINPFFPKKYYDALRLFFQEHKHYKIIHSHLNTFSSFPLKIAREFDIPCRIAHAHIALEPITIKSFFKNDEGLKESIKKLIKFQLKRKINKYNTHNFSCGEKAGTWLFGSNSFEIMNNAIDSEKFIVNESISKRYRLELEFTDDFVIGHVGRFGSQKNHIFLIEIFSEIHKNFPKSKLVLVGDGELMNKAKKRTEELNISPAVKFLGVRTDIPQLFQAMDVFVFPSFYEGLPVTLIEAQAAGLRVFASDTITKEVKITEDISFHSLTDSAEVWSNHILSSVSIKKKNNHSKIVASGFDITSNATEITNFYLNQQNYNGGN